MSQPRQLKIVVAIPMERSVHQLAFYGFMAIIQQGWSIMQQPYMRTDLARNRFAEQLLDSEFTHVLMLDADQIHPPDVVQRLGRWASQDPNKWVIGGLYFRRGEPYDPLAFIQGSDGQFYPPVDWKPGLMRVDALGTGCMLIDRRVFEAGPGPWFYYDYSRFGDGINPSEDMGFAVWCRAHGIQQWCDTTTNSPHIIDHLVTADTFHSYLRSHPEKIINWDVEANQPEKKG